MQILFKQKQAWSAFAKKNKLDYDPQSLFKSPIVRGTYRGFYTMLFSEEQPTNDQRGRRFRTIIQMELPGGMPIDGVIVSRDNHTFANNLQDLVEVYAPDFPGWDNGILIRSRNTELLKPYFTDERYRSLISIMTIKSIAAILIFDTNSTYLRFETADPMSDAGKLERMISKIADQAQVLALK